MPLVEQQPEPGRPSHGSPSELLSWLFFLIDLVRDPHFSTINSWVLLENELMLLLFCRNTVQVDKGTLCTRTNQCAISKPRHSLLRAQSELGGAKILFLPVYHVCLRLLVGGGQKRPTLKGLLHNNEFQSRHSRQVPTTLY